MKMAKKSAMKKVNAGAIKMAKGILAKAEAEGMSANKMKTAAMKMKKGAAMMMKKAAMKMKKASAMKMKGKAAMKMGRKK